MKATGFYLLVPVGASGIAFLGDRHQFVTLGKRRIPAVVDAGLVDVEVSFAAGENSRYAVWVFAATGGGGFAGGEPSCAGLGFEFGDVHGGGDAGRQRKWLTCR
jgi:hypothetical protein